MKVVNFKVIATTGENRRPSSGTATFDDGKDYDWMLCHEWNGVPEHILLFGYKQMLAGTSERYSQLFSFRSPKREAAVWEHLNK